MDGGLAWTWMHIIHGIVTFYLLHWLKGSPVDSDQVLPPAKYLVVHGLKSYCCSCI